MVTGIHVKVRSLVVKYMMSKSPMTETPEKPDNDNDAVDGLFPVDEHEEEVVEGGQKIRRKGVYVLPNLFTHR